MRSLRSNPLILIIPWTLICLLGSAFMSGFDLEAPTLIFGGAIALAPLLVYLALRRPLGLPFAMYAILAEFDALLARGPIGTIAKDVGIGVIGMLLVKVLWSKRMIKPGRELFGWFLFFAWVGVSLSWTADPGRGALYVQQYIGLFILYVLLSVSIADLTDMRLAIFSVVGAAVTLAAFELSSYSSHLSSSASVFRATLTSANKNYIDQNQLAASLQMPLALLLIVMLRERNPILKCCYLLGCAVLGGGMLATGSRAGLISAGVVFLYLLLRSQRRLQLAVIGIAGLLFSLAIPTVWERFGDQTAGEFGGRLPIWRVGWVALQDHVLFGHGAGSFIVTYQQALLKVYQPLEYFQPSIESHNTLIYASVEFGLVGVAFLLLACWFQFRALKSIPPGDPFYDLRLAIEAGTLALFVEACTLDLLTFKYIWIAFGLTEIVRGIRLRAATIPVAPPPPLHVRTTA